MALNNICEYYADRLILQYRNKYKARNTIKKLAENIYGDGIVLQLLNILDIDTAVGKQLDLIGKILGCDRNIVGLVPGAKYFSFEEAVVPYGYSTREKLSEGLWKTRYNSTLSIYALEDVDYRNLLKFKAIKNIWSGSMGVIDETLYRFLVMQ